MGWGEPSTPKPLPPLVLAAVNTVIYTAKIWREHPSTGAAEAVCRALDAYDVAVVDGR